MADKIEKKKATKKPNAISRFVRETVGELRKVSWPTVQEARRLTLIVLVVMLVVGVFLYYVDIMAAGLLALAVGL